jgi:hypothetical protein
LETKLAITLQRRHSASHDIQGHKAENGEKLRHGGGLIFFGFIVIVVQIVVVFPLAIMARTIAVIVAPVAI